MADNLDWSKDPVVQFENAVLPALWQGQSMICDSLASEKGSSNGQPVVLAAFDTAVEMLRKNAKVMLSARDIRADATDLLPLTQAAKNIETLRNALEVELFTTISKRRAATLLAQITQDVAPAVDLALNTYRRIFISHVLAQQHANALQAQEAIQRLDKISKQIFFISINASVEAARVGEAGRGFTQISTDIRALSQSAQAATRNLSDLVHNG
ncbi:MAG: methyl-accepting chemotaxis protein [Sulfitobacter sp.]